jgi:hypothetical protein
MAIWTFNSAPAGKPMIMDTLDGIDVAARYFVYKLYEATGGYQLRMRSR